VEVAGRAGYNAGPGLRGRSPLIHALVPLLDPSLPPIGIALVVALLVISLGIHEAAHGWVALQCGDTTARDLGRITLNPIAHIDLMMTIVMPVMLLATTGFAFGGAKPVPVVFHRLRHPWRDMALVAIAGPLSNFVLAALFLLCHKVLVEELEVWNAGALGPKVLDQAVYFNLLLAAFNLFPIPPLDGSRVMAWVLPESLRPAYTSLERWGIFIVIMAMVMFPPFQVLLRATMQFMFEGINLIVTLGGAW
jgi:Zn-dependent protease